MLEALLGIDSQILQETGPKERAGYRLAGWLFAGVFLSMVFADAYFGYLSYDGWAGVLVSGSFLGYIHFAVYRLAMITLTTRPLTEKEEIQKQGISTKLKSWLKPDAPNLFRLVFVGLIAMAVSFPGSAFFYLKRVEAIQTEQREVLKNEVNKGIGKGLYDPEARFPFLVFRTLIKQPGYKLGLVLWFIWIFSPLVLLSRLRNGEDMQYTRKVAKLHGEMAERDFYANLIEAQNHIDSEYGGKIKLKELILYSDPPFNTEFREKKSRRFGNQEEYTSYLNSL
jgi:hypothetical protein